MKKVEKGGRQGAVFGFMEGIVMIMGVLIGLATTGEKKDVANSARFMRNLNPFEDPSYLTLARETTKVSGTTVDELILWADDGSPHDTNRYFYGDSGSIFSESNAGVWADEREERWIPCRSG